MCKRSYYKGVEINHNIGDFGSPYYSVINNKIVLNKNRNPHVHVSNLHMAKQVIDAFINIERFGVTNHGKNIRNKALSLMNLRVLNY